MLAKRLPHLAFVTPGVVHLHAGQMVAAVPRGDAAPAPRAASLRTATPTSG